MEERFRQEISSVFQGEKAMIIIDMFDSTIT